MRVGSAGSVPSVYELHDAQCECRTSVLVEAYGADAMQRCAACHSRVINRYILLPYCHSVCAEDRFQNTHRAVSKALKLRFSVLCDTWSSEKKKMTSETSKVDGLVHVCCSSTECSRAPAEAPGFCKIKRPKGSVRFFPHVTMCHSQEYRTITSVGIDEFHSWEGKTWKLRKTKHSHAVGFLCRVSQLCTVIDADLSLPSCAHDLQSFPLISEKSQEPLSLSAVLIRDCIDDQQPNCDTFDSPVGFSSPIGTRDDSRDSIGSPLESACPSLAVNDVFSMMQLSTNCGFTCKNSPLHDDQAQLVTAFVQGQPVQVDHDALTPTEHTSSEDSEQIELESSEIQPPSSSDQRQDAILYHLGDPPMRVFLEWTSYREMIREIAFHFSRNPVEVVDAYEVQPHPSDTPAGVVPIIVHFFDDVPVGQPAKLVLLDKALHGHSFEVNYAVGPTTTRMVARMPERCVRQAVLVAADVDIYCRQESDVCFVWHGEVRWPDDDHQVRVIHHGAYFRVAVPPTTRFVCSTAEAVAFAQQGLTDIEVHDQQAGGEVRSDVSPSLLSSAEVRDLAALDVAAEADHFHTMQYRMASLGSPPHRVLWHC